MPAPQPLDLSLYVTAPRLSVPTGVALGIALLSAAPKSATQPVRRAGDRLRESVLGLQQDWRRQVDAGLVQLATPRDADNRVDRAVRATSMRLEALTLLPVDASPDVELAERAHQRLFPDGLRFLTLPYPQQWAHCERLISTLDENEELAADVERLVGETVMNELRAAQEGYGTALGITSPRESVDAVSLVEPLDAVRTAIVGYALQVVAMQSDDPSRLPAARKALAPIDAMRAAQAAQSRRPEGGAAAPQPTEPAAEDVEPEVTVTPDTPVPTLEDETSSEG